MRALVCGGSQGIGFASAVALVQKGFDVTLLARDENSLKAASLKIKELTQKAATFVVCDLENLSDGKNSVETVIRSELDSRGPIHILVNNTGGAAAGPLLEAKTQDFLSAMTRHLFAAHTLVKAVVPGMEKEKYGRIINVVSTSVREPIPGLGVSNTVRGAVAGWAKTLASELPVHITINNVLPGFTKTARLEQLKNKSAERQKKSPEQIEKEWIDSTPMRRLAEPSEVANVVAFLAGSEGSYVRGVSLAVDGGRMRSI